MISDYNYSLTTYLTNSNPIHVENCRRLLIRDGRLLDFWGFVRENKERHNFIFRSLIEKIRQDFEDQAEIEFYSGDALVNEENLKLIKNYLTKFYFIGMVDSPDDFLFIYQKLGVKKITNNQNVSNKYFVPDNYDQVRDFILAQSPFDQQLYKHAQELNIKFKHKHFWDYYLSVYLVKIRSLWMPRPKQ